MPVGKEQLACEANLIATCHLLANFLKKLVTMEVILLFLTIRLKSMEKTWLAS
jgi:hypothetical protein